MSRISYRCLPEERGLPFAEKTRWYVYHGESCVGCIKLSDSAQARSPNLRVWHPIVHEQAFDPMEFPHTDDGQGFAEPFVLTNDTEDEHNLELHYPSLMSMYEARQWIRSIVNQE
tara:strand:- start:53004 stop:53348 length:345 start_codon:yes stop_codon:yes gene_type:complete